MILCLDCGNSRIKWGLRQGEAWHGQGIVPRTEIAGLEFVTERIVASNVAGDEVAQGIEALAERLGAPLQWVKAQASACGVSNRYHQPERLGADRWAALIGARALHNGPALVVMSGTATTIDNLDEHGVFQGGLIQPGLNLMRKALALGTANLPANTGRHQKMPRNTVDAITSGCLEATLGAIERRFRRLARDPNSICLISGGASVTLAPHLRVRHRRVDNLVLEGLARIATETI